MRQVTASSLGRAIDCAASLMLPAVFEESSESAERGTAGHKSIECKLTGQEYDAPPQFRDYCNQIDVDAIRTLIADDRFETEAAYRYKPGDGTAEKLDIVDREYPRGELDAIFGTIDLVIFQETKITVIDFKTGQNVGPVAENWQMRFAALAVSRATNIDEVQLVLAYLGDNGRWTFDNYWADALDLASWEAELRELGPRLEKMQAEYDQGVLPDVFPSAQSCRYCPALRSCPAHTSLALHIANEAATLQDQIGLLDAASIFKVFEKCEQLQTILDSVKAGLKAYVEQGPISLGGGQVLTLVEQSRENIDSEKGYSVLVERYGRARADEIVKRVISKESIRKVLNGQSAEAIDRLRDAGALRISVSKSLKIVRE